MLQMLLAVVGMTMAGALGYALIEQSNAQSSLAVSREDNRRLDYAAEALTKNLIDVAPLNVLIAPIGRTNQTYNELPTNLGVITSNSKGIPFMYCPFAPVNQTALLTASLKSEASIVSGVDKSYKATTYAGGVIDQDISPHASLLPLNPVGIIISAAGISTRPPLCINVRYDNGKITVPGGLARVISLPSAAISTKNAQKTQIRFYASQNGTGNLSGENASNTAPIDGIWSLLARTKPAVASIYIVGSVSAGNNFYTYVSGERLRGVDLSIIGYETGISTSNSISQASQLITDGWIVGNTLKIKNMIINADMIISANGLLQLEGVNIIRHKSNIPFVVEKGGRLIMKSAHIKITPQIPVANVVAIFSSGEASLYSSQIILSGSGFAYILADTESHIKLVDSTVGRSSVFGEGKVKFPIYILRKGKLTSTNSNIITGDYGVCALNTGESTNVAKWIPNGPGLNSSILDETYYPTPTLTASQSAWSKYRADFTERQEARLQIAGGYECIN